ncbi:MAG: DNA primase, partial [Candidatus Bipolaricaulia bacterium]
MATREEIELIRERIDMAEFLSRYVALKRSGKNYAAICPFHADQRPSLVVDPERKLFHCFGCQAGGDLFKFLMKIERLSFGEALERLAGETGVSLSSRSSSKDKLWELNEQAARYFQENLESEAGAAARRSLAKRGIAPETMKKFRLGYALPGWDNLLKKIGRTEELAQLGLVVQGREGRYYDRFRDRIVFPLCDSVGRVIGFAGRVFRGQGDEPKYLNISNTPLFTKGEAVYGLHLARQENPMELILVEGYTDVIACHQAGLTNVIATMGTALTEQQARLLRRYVERVVLAYDRDAAGQAAALRGMRALRNAGLDVQVALLPEDGDPDSLIRAQGATTFRATLDAALPFHQFYISHLGEQARGDNPLLIERLLHEAGAFIQGIASSPLRHELIRGLSQEFGLTEEEVELELRRGQGRAPP